MSYSVADAPLSIVDPVWENIDPTPDIFAMFREYDKTYFGGTMCRVELKWSKRMTACAGLMAPLEGKGGACSIRLSEPLLKLRPRKDLVETLLHEMIHAHLHVTKCREGDPHGPKFKEHMHRINKASGTNITVFHNFIDEVNLHKQHWWRCNGPCQNWRPFYGRVKRAMNRAPSKNDFWWQQHQQTCGGKYIKVKEPEGYGKKKKTEKKAPLKTGNIMAMIKKKYNLDHPKPTVISSKFTSSKSEKSLPNGPGVKSSLKKPNTSVVKKVRISTSPESSASLSKDGKIVVNSTNEPAMNNFLGQLHKETLQHRLMSKTNKPSSLTETKKRVSKEDSDLKYVEKKRRNVSESSPPQISEEMIKNKMKKNEKDIAHFFKIIQNQNTTSTQLKIPSPSEKSPPNGPGIKSSLKKHNTSVVKKVRISTSPESSASLSKDAKIVVNSTSESAMNNFLGQLHKETLQRRLMSKTNKPNSLTQTNKRVSEEDSGLKYVEKKCRNVSESSPPQISQAMIKNKLKKNEKDRRKLPIESTVLSKLIIDDEMKRKTQNSSKNSLKNDNKLSSSSQTSLLSDKQLNSSSHIEGKTDIFSSLVNKESSSFSNSSFHSKSSTVEKSPKVQSTLSNSDTTSTENKMNSHSTSKSLDFVNSSSIKNFSDSGGKSDHLMRGSNNSDPIIIDFNEANVSCPVCGKRLPETVINQHLDNCLSMNLISEN